MQSPFFSRRGAEGAEQFNVYPLSDLCASAGNNFSNGIQNHRIRVVYNSEQMFA
jgi:hypothetical protein